MDSDARFADQELDMLLRGVQDNEKCVQSRLLLRSIILYKVLLFLFSTIPSTFCAPVLLPVHLLHRFNFISFEAFPRSRGSMVGVHVPC